MKNTMKFNVKVRPLKIKEKFIKIKFFMLFFQKLLKNKHLVIFW